VAEGAPLLRAYTLIAYRGFESLFLRQIKKPPFKGAFLFAKNSGENPSRFDKTHCVLDARRAVRRTK
jgi:hypothetical protein